MAEAKKKPANKVAKKKVAKKKVAKLKVARKASPDQRMDVHEAECALRYKRIEELLDAYNQRFSTLEKLVWGVYPFVILLYIVEKIGVS